MNESHHGRPLRVAFVVYTPEAQHSAVQDRPQSRGRPRPLAETRHPRGAADSWLPVLGDSRKNRQFFPSASPARTYSGCRRQDRAYGSVHARDVATQGFDILPDLLVLLMTFLVCTFAAWGVMQVGFEVAQSRGEIAEVIGQQAAIA